MKKIIYIAVVISLLFASATALASDSVLKMGIGDLQEAAVENSLQIKLDDNNISNNQIILDDSKYDEENYKKGVNGKRLELNLEMAKRNKQKNINNLRLSVYKQAHSILLLKEELNLQEVKLDILNTRYEMAKSRFEAGAAAESEVDDAEFNLENQRIEVDKIKDRLEMANLEMKRLLSKPLDDSETIEIADKIEFVPLGEIDINAKIEEALKNNLNIYQKTQQILINEEELEITNHRGGIGSIAYIEGEYNLKLEKKSLEDAKIQLEINIRNKYNDLLTLHDKAQLSIKYAELAEQRYKADELKYEMGLINKEAYLSARERYLDAMYQKNAAICSYNNGKAEFDIMLVQ